MLILTRRTGESIVMQNRPTHHEEDASSAHLEEQSVKIGNMLIKVTILGVKGNQIRIGVDAPENVIVDREEIFHKRMKEKNEHQLLESEEDETFYE